MKTSKTAMYIDALAALNGRSGFTFTQAQVAIWNINHSNKPFHRKVKYNGRWVNANRGYMCLALIGSGSGYSRLGILKCFFDKGADGRYRRNGVDHEGRPFDVMRRISSNRKWVEANQKFAKAMSEPDGPQFAPGVKCAGERSTAMKVEQKASTAPSPLKIIEDLIAERDKYYTLSDRRLEEINKLQHEATKLANENDKMHTELGKSALTVDKAIEFLMQNREKAAHAVLEQLLKGVV